MWLRKYAPTLTLILAVLWLANCARNIPENHSFCLLTEDIYYSFKDNEATKREIDKHNATRACLCNHEIDYCKEAGI